MRKTLTPALVLLLVASVGLTGCATKKWVDEQISSFGQVTNTKINENTSAIEGNQNTEAPGCHGRIDNSVEHGCLVAFLGSREDTEKNETDMRDGRVGQHALDVVLGDGDDVAERHREH